MILNIVNQLIIKDVFEDANNTLQKYMIKINGGKLNLAEFDKDKLKYLYKHGKK